MTVPAAPDPGLEGLFQHAPCGYLVLGPDGRVARVNETFLTWTGRAREDVVGAALTSLLPVGDRILWSTHCAPQLAVTGAIDEVAVEVVGADGARHPALLTATRVPATDEAPASVRVILFSARERRAYEVDLLAARRRAEQSDSRRAQAEAGLQRLVLHDPLTGLLNRNGLTAELTGRLTAPGAGGSRPAGTLALLFVDLDGFKTVNDSLGHAAGDELLTLVARCLQGLVRSTGTLARFAGDEFVVLDRVSSPQEAATLARRLTDALRQPVVVQGLEVAVSVCIGIALEGDACGAAPPGRRDVDAVAGDLLRHADMAMYRAKARGRGCWELHDPSVSDPAADRLRLLDELRQGMTRDELRVHYQPRIDLRTGRLDGLEALVRWDHPDRGLLQPGAFIEAAEQSGLIRELGARVLDEAVRQTVTADARTPPGQPPINIAVNLSTRQLADPGLVDRVTAVLDRHGLAPARLTLELTETALMHDPDGAHITLTALKRLGVELAIDDFGTGYSSLTYLQRFPIDELKIDRSFVAGLHEQADHRAIVASCIHLAHALGIRAVGEGVEDVHQHSALRELGCDLAQGYLYSRPVPFEELRRPLLVPAAA